ncbi:MAG TPA: hypothetical protein DCE56_13640 [Cyanobacteria bacterium UBA8553]|nr:hypothetical protein [Cyanobacteria bacterium UBA8553]
MSQNTKNFQEISLYFKNQPINIAITKLGDCWWNLRDLCSSLELELWQPKENQEELISAAKTFKLNNRHIKEITTAGDKAAEIMLNFSGLERLVDYAPEVTLVNDFCEWIVEIAFPAIWENQPEEVLILVKGQKQESSEANQPTEETALLMAA